MIFGRCEGGTFGNGTGLTSSLDCEPVQTGYWAPTGAALPEECFSGFYCPGRANDDKNGDKPGSKPIIVPKGSSTESKVVKTVEKDMTLPITREEYNETAVRHELAALYGVPVELIELSLPDARRRRLHTRALLAMDKTGTGGSGHGRARALTSGLQITITIKSAGPPSSPSSGSTSSAPATIDFNALVAAVNSVDDAALGSSMSSALGKNVTVTSTAPQTMDVTLIVEKDCPLGYWCSAGEETKCEVGTYNPNLNVLSATGCLACPMPNAITLQEASTSLSDCVCDTVKGFVEIHAADGNRTCVCSPGWAPNEATPAVCVPCGLRTYKESYSNNACQSCPADADTLTNASQAETDCVCTKGMFDNEVTLSNRTCVTCPSNTGCANEQSPWYAPGVTLHSLPVERNSWRSHMDSALIKPCITQDACEGGPVSCMTVYCHEYGNRTGPGCRQGHTGPYCEVCIPNFYKSQGLCKECTEDGVFIASLVAPAAIVIFLIVLCALFLRGKLKGNSSGKYVAKTGGQRAMEHMVDDVFGHDEADGSLVEDQERRVAKATLKWVRQKSKAAGSGKRCQIAMPKGLQVDFKILVSLVQVLGALKVTFSIPFPPIYSFVMRWMSVLEMNLLEIAPLSCQGFKTNFHSLLVVRTALPALWLTICFAAKACCRCGTRAEAVADKMLSTAFFVLFLVYPTNAQKLFLMFLCEDFEDGSKVLRADWEIDCKSTEHAVVYTAYTIFMLLVPMGPFGTPIIYAWLVNSAYGSTIRRMRANEKLMLELREEALADEYVKRLTVQAKTVAMQAPWGKAAKRSRKPNPVTVPTDDDLPDAVKQRIAALGEAQEEHLASLPDYMKKLLSGYNYRNAGFESYECVRKLALVCMPSFFQPGSPAQLIFGLLVCFVTFGMYTAIKPYEEARANVLAQICQVQIFFALVSAIALSFDQSDKDASTRTLDIMLTVLTFMPLAIGIALRTPLIRLLDAAERAKFERKLRRRCCGRAAISGEERPAPAPAASAQDVSTIVPLSYVDPSALPLAMSVPQAFPISQAMPIAEPMGNPTLPAKAAPAPAVPTMAVTMLTGAGGQSDNQRGAPLSQDSSSSPSESHSKLLLGISNKIQELMSPVTSEAEIDKTAAGSSQSKSLGPLPAAEGQGALGA